MTFRLNERELLLAVALTGCLSMLYAFAADSQTTYGSVQDSTGSMRIPDFRSNYGTGAPSPAQPAEAPPMVTQFGATDDRMRLPLAWRASAYNLATNKLSARSKWTVPVAFDKTKSYLEAALAQLGFAIKSAYPQAGQFLVVPAWPDRASAPNAQIIIVAQPTSENETALQMLVTGDSRGLDQQKVQQIPQMMLMVIQRKGLL